MKRSREKGSSNKVTIVNPTDFRLGFWGISLEFRTAEQAEKGFGYCSTTCRSPEPHSSVEVELLVDHNGAEVVSWKLNLRKKGLQWKKTPSSSHCVLGDDEGGGCVVEVVGGDVCEIEVDETNAPLNDHQVRSVRKSMFHVLERGVLDSSTFWSTVANELTTTLGGKSGEQLKNVYEHQQTRDETWRMWYQPDDIVESNDQMVERVMMTTMQQWRVDVYYRALDRFPGGNADMHTVMYRVTRERVVGHEHVNWDGQQEIIDFIPPELNDRLGDLLPQLCQCIVKCAQMDGIHSECTLRDMITMDREEYDTEWSSVEVLLSIPRVWSPTTHKLFSPTQQNDIRTLLLINIRMNHILPRDIVHIICSKIVEDDDTKWRPLFRLHQYSVPGIHRYGHDEKQPLPTHIEPSVTQRSLLECVHKFIGMGRVNQYSDAGDGQQPCQAALDKQNGMIRPTKTSPHCSLPYLQPIYFRDF